MFKIFLLFSISICGMFIQATPAAEFGTFFNTPENRVEIQMSKRLPKIKIVSKPKKEQSVEVIKRDFKLVLPDGRVLYRENGKLIYGQADKQKALQIPSIKPITITIH